MGTSGQQCDVISDIEMGFASELSYTQSDSLSETNGEHLSNRTINGRIVTEVTTDEYTEYSLIQSDLIKMIPQRLEICQHRIENSVNSLCKDFYNMTMEGTLWRRRQMLSGLDSAYSQHGETEHEHLDIYAQDIYMQDNDGDTLLHNAIILHEASFAISFINLATSFTLLSIKNHLCQTPLHLAVLTHQTAIVRRLIVGGADIESRDRDGNTALHIACREGFIDIVDTLLEPVQYSETKQNRHGIQYQRIPQNLEIRNYDGVNCLHLASFNGHLQIVKVLSDKGVDINSIDGRTGRTILHKACLDENFDIVKLLLSITGCDIHARTYDDFTPFDFLRGQYNSIITEEKSEAGAQCVCADGIMD